MGRELCYNKGKLIDQEVPVSLEELTKEFSWKKLSGDSIFLDPARLGNAK